MRANTAADFWSRVDFTNPFGCWEWRGGTFKQGYGEFSLRGKNWFTHRLARQLVFGDLREGVPLCHQCDNRRCVNPFHVEHCTIAQNNRERADRGRSHPVVGDQNPMSKLTWDNVKEIRAALASGAKGIDLAKQYGVGTASISLIRRGKRWKEPVGESRGQVAR